MDYDRLRKIMKYSDSNQEIVESRLREFYSLCGMSNHNEMLNILQIVRTSLLGKGYLVLELPFADKEIGALCYRGDALGYVVLNSSLPKVNVNFAACHEIYHVYFQQNESMPKVEFANDRYYEYEEESAANLFAGMLLMPEAGFRFMYHKFKVDSDGDELSTMVRLMSYYEVPYMSVLVRCCELGLSGINSISEKLLGIGKEIVRDKFLELWLDGRILEATKKDDYAQLEAMVERIGKANMEDAYINGRTLKKVLQNMRSLYLEIKGE